mmetsp:Transcript_28025/g.79206  ORF Transcript_28025/g.79206 Transcript_28025/m.79206 type:complete len:211 (-) Transcript_28025:395-1027(-)
MGVAGRVRGQGARGGQGPRAGPRAPGGGAGRAHRRPGLRDGARRDAPRRNVAPARGGGQRQKEARAVPGALRRRRRPPRRRHGPLPGRPVRRRGRGGGRGQGQVHPADERAGHGSGRGRRCWARLVVGGQRREAFKCGRVGWGLVAPLAAQPFLRADDRVYLLRRLDRLRLRGPRPARGRGAHGLLRGPLPPQDAADQGALRAEGVHVLL